MRDSIRWTLIGWYGLLLVAVLGAFGTTLYMQAVDATMGGVDRDLDDGARALAAALEHDPEDGWEIDLSEDYLRGLAAGGYFRVWAVDGTPVMSGGDGGPDGPPGPPGLHTRGDLREMALDGPAGSRILVGRSILPERERLADLLAVVVGVGLGVLVLGLCGGWWLARRTLAPVGALTQAAAAVGPDDLSTRLDEERAPAELRELARAFNATLDRLEGAFQRQARFTADASHELRTPVSIVRTQAELALREQRSEEDYRATLSVCLRAAERMTHLVEGLLALARADAGGEQTTREDVELDALVRETTELLHPAAEAEEVRLQCTAQPARVHGDPRLLAEVVSNLVDNGVRYNRKGGSVDVDLVRENGQAVLRVRDTGIGIAAEAQEHLFERFFRVDPARSRRHGGSGLGLAITRWIVEAHDGSIEVESRPGTGSTFTVRLPATAAQSHMKLC